MFFGASEGCVIMIHFLNIVLQVSVGMYAGSSQPIAAKFLVEEMEQRQSYL